MDELLKECREFVREKLYGRPVGSIDDIEVGQPLIIIAQVRAQNIRFAVVESYSVREEPFMGAQRRTCVIEPTLPEISRSPYHIITDYIHGKHYISAHRIENSRPIELTDEMFARGQVFSVANFPRDVADLASRYIRK